MENSFEKRISNNSGYSGTPLARKLGIKSGCKVRFINQPDYYLDLFIDFPEKVEIVTEKEPKKDLIHYFITSKETFFLDLPNLKSEIQENGIIWVSWPKKSSKIQTEVSENTIRDFILVNGLVDIKVCSVDETWSALKLVIPLKERATHNFL